METNHLVSIITATYNSELFIEDTIQSVLYQTYKKWELIIIDDASNDSTIEIVLNYCEKYNNIKLLKNKVNQGAAVTRNKGIEAAIGNFIAFLDADDLWKPNKLEKQLKFMLDHKTNVSFSSYCLMDETGNSLGKIVEALPELSYKKFLKCNYIGNLTGMYNAKALGKIYSPNLRKRQDWLLWLKAVEKSKSPALGIKEPLAMYRIRENSISSNKINLLRYNYNVYRIGLKFSGVKSVYHLLIFLFEYFFVKSKQTVTIEKT